MRKNDFIRVLERIIETNEYIDKLNNLNISLYESPMFESWGIMCDMVFDCYYNEEGVDLINWWLYEDVDKVLYDKDSTIDIHTPEQLWEYLNSIHAAKSVK